MLLGHLLVDMVLDILGVICVSSVCGGVDAHRADRVVEGGIRRPREGLFLAVAQNWKKNLKFIIRS